MLPTPIIRVSVIVDQKYGELAVRALHDGFDLANSVPVAAKATKSA